LAVYALDRLSKRFYTNKRADRFSAGSRFAPMEGFYRNLYLSFLNPQCRASGNFFLGWSRQSWTISPFPFARSEVKRYPNGGIQNIGIRRRPNFDFYRGAQLRIPVNLCECFRSPGHCVTLTDEAIHEMGRYLRTPSFNTRE